MTKMSLFAVVLALVAGSAPAIERSYTYRPVSISFVPGFSTNGQEWKTVSSNLSLNIIGGSIGRVQGVELGGVFNVDEGDVLGYQGAGVFNVVSGTFAGLEQAGVFNIVEREFTGAQMAGVISIAEDEFRGAQATGVINVAGNGCVGTQLAGVVNVCDHGFYGAQIAGVANVAAEQMYGLQLSGVVNVADEFEGAQIGLVNITERGRGLQLGLVNVADEMDYPIGLVSIIGNGMFHANIWATDFAPLNIGIKTGSRIIYNVFSVGYGRTSGENRLYAALGIGVHIPLNRFFVDIDVLNHGVYREGHWFEEGGSDLLSSLRLSGGWQLTDFLAVTAGPTLNLSVEDVGGHEETRVRPGFAAGLQLF